MSYSIFKKLHEQNNLLVLGNIWDAQSAKIAEQAGFQALGTSSHAMANLLGYEDGEQINIDEILFLVDRIVNSVSIPVSVDFESGYSDNPEIVAKYVKQLANIGVVGINIEDSIVIEGNRILQKSANLSAKIKAIKANNPEVFINARTDTYTTKHQFALEESIQRAKEYEHAGADGLFIPLLEKNEDIQRILSTTNLPLNVFLTPNLTNVTELSAMGVKRLSHGAKIFEWLAQTNKDIFVNFIKNQKLPQ